MKEVQAAEHHLGRSPGQRPNGLQMIAAFKLRLLGQATIQFLTSRRFADAHAFRLANEHVDRDAGTNDGDGIDRILGEHGVDVAAPAARQGIDRSAITDAWRNW